jgi:uncharacterized protein YoxC
MTEIILFVVSIALLVFLGYAIFSLVQIRRTAKGLAETIEGLNQRLPLIVKNLEEITSNTLQATNAVKKQVDDLSTTVARINGAMNYYLEKEEIFRQQVGIPVADAFHTTSAVVKGIRAFLDSWKSGASSVSPGRSL